MPYDGDISTDMTTITDRPSATNFVVPSSEVGEAAPGQDPYLPKMMVYVPTEDDSTEEARQEPEKIAELKRYLSNPTPELSSLIGNVKYIGAIDNNIDDQVVKISTQISLKINSILGNVMSPEIILNSSADEIQSAALDITKYLKFSEKQAKLRTIDDRIYSISKLLFEKK